MLFRKTALALTVASVLAGAVPLANAAGYFTNGLPVAGGSQYPTTIPLTGNETIPADTNLPSGLNPASEAITTAQIAVFGLGSNPRNYLENGGMDVQQQGTGIQTCGTNTAPTNFAFAADRWFCDSNVIAAAARTQIATSGGVPLPPTGSLNSVKVYRTSGALTQPVCLMQQIESSRASQLAGKSVMFSSQLQALAGFTAANSTVSLTVITGTGTDEGFGTLSTSPLITPAWTGLATAGTASFTTTTSWVRYNSAAIAIPATATEVGVLMCFTPVGSSSGLTDGFAMTQSQLEAVATGATTPSAYEFQPFDRALLAAKRFFEQFNEPANAAGMPGICQTASSNTALCTLNLATVMRGTTPVLSTPTLVSFGSFKISIGTSLTPIATATAGTCSTFACTLNAGSTNFGATTNGAAIWTGGGGTGVITVNSDKVL